MSVGDNIRRIRKSKDMTLEEVGNKVGLPRQTIQRYESGAIRNIPYDKLIAIAKALGCSGADFFIDETTNYTPADFYTPNNAKEIVNLIHDNATIELIKKINQLSFSNKKIVESLVDGLLDNQKEQTP